MQQQEEKILRVMNAVAAGTTDQTSSAVDMALEGGWESCEFVALFGTLTATQVTTIKAQQSSDDAATDAYSDLAGSATAALADGDSNKIARLQIVRPLKHVPQSGRRPRHGQHRDRRHDRHSTAAPQGADHRQHHRRRQPQRPIAGRGHRVTGREIGRKLFSPCSVTGGNLELTMKVILKHMCHSPLYGGQPGDVVTVPDEVGQRWLRDQGAVAFIDAAGDDDDEPAPRKRGRKPNAEAPQPAVNAEATEPKAPARRSTAPRPENETVRPRPTADSRDPEGLPSCMRLPAHHRARGRTADAAVVKRRLRPFDNSNDEYVETVLVPAAAATAEAETHRQLLTAQLRIHARPLPVRLPADPDPSLAACSRSTRSPTSTPPATSKTVDPANYLVLSAHRAGGDVPAYSKAWPVTRYQPAAVVVTLTAGYGENHESLPAPLKSAMLLLIGHLFLNREAVVVGTIGAELPMAVREIFTRYRVGDDFDDYDISWASPGRRGADMMPSLRHATIEVSCYTRAWLLRVAVWFAVRGWLRTANWCLRRCFCTALKKAAGADCPASQNSAAEELSHATWRDERAGHDRSARPARPTTAPVSARRGASSARPGVKAKPAPAARPPRTTSSGPRRLTSSARTTAATTALIAPLMRVLLADGRILPIVSATDENMKHKTMLITCQETG